MLAACRLAGQSALEGTMGLVDREKLEPLVHRLASVVDVGRVRLGAVCEHAQEVGERRVAVLRHEARHIEATALAARFADDGERRRANVGQKHRTAAGHGRTIARHIGKLMDKGLTELASGQSAKRQGVRPSEPVDALRAAGVYLRCLRCPRGGRAVKHPITALIAGGVLALALFGSAAAGPLDEGYAAYQRGDYAEALRMWRQLGDQGLAGAQFDLGFMYAMAVACR